MARKKDSEGMKVDSADWQARATHIRQVLGAAPDTAVAEALGTFLFEDDDDKTWTYNGAAWMSWDGTQWAEGEAPATLHMQPFLHEASAAEAAEDAERASTKAAAAAPEIATAAAATTGEGAAMAETPEAAAAEAAVDDKPAVGATVSSGAILAAIAASDGQTPASDAGKTDTAASDAPAATPAADAAAAREPASTHSGMAAGAAAGAAATAADAGMSSAGSAPAAQGGMGTSGPATSQPAAGMAAAAAGNECARQRRRILFTGCVPRNTHRPIAGHGCLDQTGSERSPRVPVGCPNRADGGRDDLQRLGPSGRLQRLDRLGRRPSTSACRRDTGTARGASGGAGGVAAACPTGSAELAATGPATCPTNLAATRATGSAELAATGQQPVPQQTAGVAAARRCSGSRSNCAGGAATATTAGRFPANTRRATDGHAGVGSAKPGVTAAGSACARHAAPGCGVEPERLGARCRVQRVEWLGRRSNAGGLRPGAIPALSFGPGCCWRLASAADRSGRALVALGHAWLEPEAAGDARLGQLVRVEDLS